MDTVVRHRPEGLEALCRQTKFTKKEIQHMYRGFKQECPSGTIDEETFKDIYGQFFPLGDARPYAHHVFNALDTTRNGCVNFEELLSTLSVIVRGSMVEKIRWTFSLYDINKDGYVTKQELMEIISSIYAMMGHAGSHSDRTARDHVEKVFPKMDLNRDGIITLEEFLDSCLQVIFFLVINVSVWIKS
uniref:EF-hand domain-containing protein n=1 Tax=Strigamia maritima TaxID=126957 RepID=T1JPF4_STRMM